MEEWAEQEIRQKRQEVNLILQVSSFLMCVCYRLLFWLSFLGAGGGAWFHVLRCTSVFPEGQWEKGIWLGKMLSCACSVPAGPESKTCQGRISFCSSWRGITVHWSCSHCLSLNGYCNLELSQPGIHIFLSHCTRGNAQKRSHQSCRVGAGGAASP